MAAKLSWEARFLGFVSYTLESRGTVSLAYRQRKPCAIATYANCIRLSSLHLPTPLSNRTPTCAPIPTPVRGPQAAGPCAARHAAVRAVAGAVR